MILEALRTSREPIVAKGGRIIQLSPIERFVIGTISLLVIFSPLLTGQN